MGRVSKGVQCSVIGCSNQAKKSLSYDRASLAKSITFSSSSRKVYLCDDHYKIWKKETKEIREIERIRWG